MYTDYCCLGLAARENKPATPSLQALAAPAAAAAPCGSTGLLMFEKSRLRCKWPSIPGAQQYPLGSRHFLQAAVGSAVLMSCAEQTASAPASSGGDTAGDIGDSCLISAPSSTWGDNSHSAWGGQRCSFH